MRRQCAKASETVKDLLAHEIGHLLLGSNSHTRTDYAAAVGPRHVRQIMVGTLFFTREQSSRMREEARTRMTLQTANLDPGHIPQSD